MCRYPLESCRAHSDDKKGGKSILASECVMFFCTADLLKYPWLYFFLKLYPSLIFSYETYLLLCTSRSSSKPDMSQFQALEAKCLGSILSWLAVAATSLVGPAPRMKRNNSMPSIATRARQVGKRNGYSGDGWWWCFSLGERGPIVMQQCQHYHSIST